MLKLGDQIHSKPPATVEGGKNKVVKFFIMCKYLYDQVVCYRFFYSASKVLVWYNMVIETRFLKILQSSWGCHGVK